MNVGVSYNVEHVKPNTLSILINNLPLEERVNYCKGNEVERRPVERQRLQLEVVGRGTTAGFGARACVCVGPKNSFVQINLFFAFCEKGDVDNTDNNLLRGRSYEM